MQKKQITTVALLIVLAVLLALRLLQGAPETARRSDPQEHTEIAEIKKHMGILEERVNALEERLAEPRRYGYKVDPTAAASKETAGRKEL